MIQTAAENRQLSQSRVISDHLLLKIGSWLAQTGGRHSVPWCTTTDYHMRFPQKRAVQRPRDIQSAPGPSIPSHHRCPGLSNRPTRMQTCLMHAGSLVVEMKNFYSRH